MILEGTQLVNNDHVKIKRHSAAFNEPLHILTVDDVEVCLLPECRKPLFTPAQHQTVNNVINLKRLLNGKQNVWKYQNGEEKSDSDGREKDV